MGWHMRLTSATASRLSRTIITTGYLAAAFGTADAALGPAHAYRLSHQQRLAHRVRPSQPEPSRIVRSLAGFKKALFLTAIRKEQQGLRNEVYTRYFDHLIEHHRAPADDLDISDYIFLRAQRAIVNRAPINAEHGPVLPGVGGSALPVGMFATLHDELARTFVERLDLDPATGDGLATLIEREAVLLAGVDYPAYVAALGASRPGLKEITTAILTAQDALFASSTIDVGFEVPYVAGYDRNDGTYVLIDCSVPLGPKLNGHSVPVAKLLNVHERVEKALLDQYGIRYQSAHQIALRIEKATSDAIGAPWKAYDDLISAISDGIYARPIARVSDQLDLQPYYSFEDAENRRLIDKLLRALVPQAAFARPIDKERAEGAAGACPVAAKHEPPARRQ
jgi:hypothetical protein